MNNLSSCIKQLTSLFRRKRVAILISAGMSVILSFLSYILNNQPLFTGEDLNKFAWLELTKDKFGIKKPQADNRPLFVNVSYDKQLVPVCDTLGFPKGDSACITDRNKLLKFLQILHKTNQYSYIFLDVRFEKGYDVPGTDSLLFDEIKSMRNIVVATHENMAIVDSSIIDKTGINDYYSTITATNFTRYLYKYGEKPSVALYAYKDITKNDINKHLFFYTCDGHLCYNSLFVDFPVEDFDEYDNIGKKQYYNLGIDLLRDETSDEDISVLSKGKYVIIGDMVEDLHDSYSGLKPGSVITYYAFRSLLEGKHFVSYGLMLFMALVYFIISLFIFSRKSVFNKIAFIRNSKSQLLHFVISLIKYPIILFIVVLILNIFWNISTSIFIPSFCFAIQEHIINLKNKTI